MDRRIVIIAAFVACLAIPSGAVEASPEGSPLPQEPAAQDLLAELGGLVDEAAAVAVAAAAEVDLEALVGAAGAIDVGAAVDSGFELTRDLIGAAETWVGENPEIVCDGGSTTTAAAAAAVIGYVTGSPGVALRAFEEVERVARETCAGYVGLGEE